MKKETQKKKWTKKTKERGEKVKNNSYGITLIALVITVIVLLILAGISISMLSGDNSILRKATEAKDITGISEVEEALKLEYLSLLTGQYVGEESATFAKAIDNYNTKNPTKPQVTSESASGQLEIDKVELSDANIQIGVDAEGNANVGTLTVTVTPKQGSGIKHYVTVSGNKYEVKDTNGDIKIDRTPTTSTGEGTGITIGATVADDTIATASVSGTTVTITGKLKAGSTTLNLTINGIPYTDKTINIVAKAVLKPGGTAVATETDNYTDSTGKTATVPAGFTVSSETGTTEGKTNETLIDNGLVIKKGSDSAGWDEYVWIEVPKDGSGPNYTAVKSTTEGTEGYYTAIENALVAYAGFPTDGTWGGNSNTDQKTKKCGWKDEWYDKNNKKATDSGADLTNTEGCGLTSEGYTKQYQRMLKSVYTNGGFWIGRYEAGVTSRTSRKLPASSPTPKSQAGKNPYTYVYCSDAQILAARVATEDTTNNANSKNYTSSLMFGIQWDLVCKFLEVKTSEWPTENTPGWYIKTDSSSWGVYNTSVRNSTGSSPTYRKRNIYDFAGNVYEWTLEHANSGSYGPCAERGGGYNFKGSDIPASGRGSYGTAGSSDLGRFSCLTLLV